MNHPFVNLLLRWLILALGVLLAERLLPGIRCDSGTTLVVVVLLLSLFNVVLKPLLLLFTLPFIILSMGFGIWLINALLFYVVGQLVDGFYVAGFGSAMLGALIVSVTNIVINLLLASPPKPPSPPSGGSGGKRDDVIDI